MYAGLKEASFKPKVCRDAMKAESGQGRVLRQADRYTRRTWLHTLDEIRAAPVTHSQMELKELLIEMWIEHGDVFDLDETTERRRQKPRASEPDPPLLPCSWSLCLCAEYEATHVMYICKGCSEALYCSKKCQKKYVLPSVRSFRKLTLRKGIGK